MDHDRRWYDQLGTRPWSGNQLRELGKAIVAGGSSTDALSYSELVDWNNTLIFSALGLVRTAAESELASEDLAPFIASRAKTLETVRDKLVRDRHRPLGRIQDLAGIRVIADMGLDMQAAVAERIARDLRQGPGAVESRLDGSHAGYRALHVVCVFEDMGGAMLEVQVRTTLQNAWANLYDALADQYGRHIRYGAMPDDPGAAERVSRVRGLVSLQVAQLEERANRLRKLKEQSLTVAELPADVVRQIDDAQHDVNTRAELLRRTMEDEEAQVRRESKLGGET